MLRRVRSLPCLGRPVLGGVGLVMGGLEDYFVLGPIVGRRLHSFPDGRGEFDARDAGGRFGIAGDVR